MLSFGVLMLMALLLYGCELQQARRARRRQLAEQTRAHDRAALLSSSLRPLDPAGSRGPAGSTAGSTAGSGQLQAKLAMPQRHQREASLLAMLNRPQVT